MAEQKMYIDLKPLSDDEIKEANLEISDLWMVKAHDNKIFGPYDTVSLREYSQTHPDLFEDTSVYNLHTEQWSIMFSTGQFQRRKPSLVAAQNLIKNNEFYLLHEGQKNGPHSKEEIQHLLDTSVILASSQISLDNGHTWIKIYEHHSFDRRSKKSNQELPFVPDKLVLEQINSTKSKIMSTKETEDAIAGLAFIGHGNEQAQSITGSTEIERALIANATARNSSSKFRTITLSTLVVFTIALVSFYQINKSDINEFKTAIKEVKTQKRSINNNQRANRKPASVKKFVNKQKKYVPLKKIKRIQPKRFTKPAKRIVETHKRDIFEDEIETLDINDPEVQEELTRQLAGEYNELDGEELSEEDAYHDEEAPFEEDELIEHQEEDY